MEAEGGVLANGAQRLPRLGHRCHHLGVVPDTERAQMAGHDGLGPATHDHLEAEVGQPLGQQTLGGTDEEDGLLPPLSATYQPDLLAGVLGVVARVGLVGHQVGQAGGQDGKVGVDGHPALQPAQVVVEPGPRLVRSPARTRRVPLRAVRTEPGSAHGGPRPVS